MKTSFPMAFLLLILTSSFLTVDAAPPATTPAVVQGAGVIHPDVTNNHNPPATAPAANAAPAAAGLTVAVLDFKADTPGSPDLGSQISEVLTASLSGENGFTLVDRSSLLHVIQEHELNMTGLVDSATATKIGKLVGAKILITGKVFTVGKQIYMTAKLIGTETSLVEGVVVKGDTTAGVDPLIVKLADKLTERLPIAGPRLIAKNDAALDPMPGLTKALAGKELPKVAVRISERHMAEVQAAHYDPAAETELKMMLTQAGFTVVDGSDSELAKAGVTVLITGEGFSEFATRIGTLVSCTDRVELKMTDFSSGKVLLADRDNNRAVDQTDNLAGKEAMQKSARLLGVHVLQYFVDNLPAKKP